MHKKKLHMRDFILILFFSFSTFLSFSQYIEGKVVDATTNEPIKGVNVFMEGIGRGAVTNEKGNYYLKFPYRIVKNDIITFSHITYGELKVPYVQKKKNYSVSLLVDLTKLEEVRISERRNLKKSISYKKLSSMKSAVHSFGAMLKDNKIYIVGGDVSFEENYLKKLMEYDPDRALQKFMNGTARNFNKQGYSGNLQVYTIETDTWLLDKSKFRKRAYHNLNYYNDKIYVVGGKNLMRHGVHYREYLDDNIEVFNIEKDTTFIDKTNPHQAIDFASFTYDDTMILIGGSLKMKNNGFKEYSNKVHLYNLKSGYWYELGNMPVAKETQGVLIEDKIYLVGGFNDKPLSSIESFDLKTQKWKKEGDFFYGISKLAITHNNNIIYFFNKGKISTYNILTKELNEYSIELSIEGSEMYYNNNVLYIFGGFKGTNFSIFPSAQLFSINLDEFENTKIQNSKTL